MSCAALRMHANSGDSESEALVNTTLGACSIDDSASAEGRPLIPFGATLANNTLFFGPSCGPGIPCRLGNSLMQYWNARGYAFFQGMAFETDMVTVLPKTRPASQPSPMMCRLWNEVLRSRSAGSVQYPHELQYEPWRLIQDVIVEDTSAAVSSQAARLRPEARDRLTWSRRFDTAVLHHRCDSSIGRNPRYGLIRYGFVRENLPNGTAHILIVGQVDYPEPLCKKLLRDLVSWLQEDRNISVRFQKTGVTEAEDWLTLATARVVFCSISTFCLSATMGNPNLVYFPVNGAHMVVQEDGPNLKKAGLFRSLGFHWVPYDFVPGFVTIYETWDTVRNYLRGNKCDQRLLPCVPVGGKIPEKYLANVSPELLAKYLALAPSAPSD